MSRIVVVVVSKTEVKIRELKQVEGRRMCVQLSYNFGLRRALA